MAGFAFDFASFFKGVYAHVGVFWGTFLEEV